MQLCYAFWCVLLGGWSLRVECFGSKGMQTLSWALPLGCVLWSLWIVFNAGQWHYCCFVRLSRPLGNACQLSFKCIPLFCFAVFSFAVDPPTVGEKKKKDFCIRLLLAKRCSGEFKSFSKFEIIFTLAPVRISDNCCWYLVQGGRFFPHHMDLSRFISCLLSFMGHEAHSVEWWFVSRYVVSRACWQVRTVAWVLHTQL